MHISLDEAIDMHSRVMTGRMGEAAVRASLERAVHCRTMGDFEGERVWLRVGDCARRRLRKDERGAGEPRRN